MKPPEPSLESALAKVEASTELDPILRALLAKCFDRSIDLQPRRWQEAGPWGSSYTVIGEQSEAAKEVIAAAAMAASMLEGYPTFALLRPKAADSSLERGSGAVQAAGSSFLGHKTDGNTSATK